MTQLVRSGRRPFRLSFQSVPVFEEMEKRMQSLMEDVFGRGVEPEQGNAIGWLPAMEVTESPTEIEISAELAGLQKKDVDISVSDEGVLTVSGEKTEEKSKASDDKTYHLWERSYGSFRRSFTLPRSADASRIGAEFRNGLLKIRIPKVNGAQAKGRQIEIKDQP